MIRLIIRRLYNRVNTTNLISFQELHKKAFSSKYLLITNLSISLGLSSVGDIIEQQYEIHQKLIEKYDKKRTLHMALSGVTVGFICHYWYKILDARYPGRSISIVLKKLLLDQFICSPAYLSVFFFTLALLENKTWDETIQEIKEKAWKLYLAEWMIWPPAQIINFYMLPPKYRVLYDNTISLGYDVFTSNVKHNS